MTTPSTPPKTPASSAPSGPSTRLKMGSVGVLGITFFVLSAQAPLTGVVGPTPITIGLGNGPGAPGASLLVGLVMCIFAIGFIEMSRRLDTHGAFYAYISSALGRRMGVASAWLAILSYGVIQGAMYGLYAPVLSGIIAEFTGIEIPWWLILLLTIGVVLVLGSRNIELGARVLAILVLLEFLVLGAFCIGVLLRGGGPEGISFTASFSPAAFLAGAPGIPVVFAVASMLGFESTAIYSSEAKNPAKTIPRATYLAIAVVSLFYAFALWMVVSYYGASQVTAAAQASLEGDTSLFVISAMADVLGEWVAPVAAIMLVTSLLAGIIAFHNGVNRYLHSLATRRALPHRLAHVNKHHAPYVAARVQSVMAVLTAAPFIILGMDPTVTLFPWGGGLGVVGLLVLYLLCSLSVVVFFTRRRETVSVIRTRVAPVAALILLALLLAVVINNFPMLVDGTWSLAGPLLALVPLFFVGGLISTYFFRGDGPEVLEPGPFRGNPHEPANPEEGTSS